METDLVRYMFTFSVSLIYGLTHLEKTIRPALTSCCSHKADTIDPLSILMYKLTHKHSMSLTAKARCTVESVGVVRKGQLLWTHHLVLLYRCENMT